jgi:hypothetical protein
MKYIAIRHIAVFAALVLSSAANAATYTAHYDYVRKPALPDAAIDAQLQADTANCDNAIGVQRATPSAGYRSCMLQQGWKYRFLTRDPVHISARMPKSLPAISSIMTTGWTARTPAAPRSAIRPTGPCTISTRIRIWPARAPARCRSARTCERLVAEFVDTQTVVILRHRVSPSASPMTGSSGVSSTLRLHGFAATALEYWIARFRGR